MKTYNKDGFMADFWDNRKIWVNADALKEQMQILEKYRMEAESLKEEVKRLKATNQYLAGELQEFKYNQIFVDLRA